jgi:pyrimidine-nucleoside phosphorylase
LSFDIHKFLATRRDGGVHSREELFEFSLRVGHGGLPDYQVSAWLMAAVLRPLGREETVWLTQGMAASGCRLDLSGLPKPWVDKHSTGGVGDKTTLVLLPLLAACGLSLVKMSGRGLGITGGTLDKLASVPGFRLDPSPEELVAVASEVGCALSGQSPLLAPADKALYALRDATETVASLPLIVSSILSKKLAGGAETVMIDVKCGSGGFMPDLASASSLATSLREVGAACGLAVRTAITDMSQPLGAFVGNALEVNEAWAVLSGAPLSGPSLRFRELCLGLAKETLAACGMSVDPASVLESGQALSVAERWFRAQGATALPPLPVTGLVETVVSAPRSGFVSVLDAGSVGRLVLGMGGGRRAKEDAIDVSVGVQVHVCVGDFVPAGMPLLTVFGRTAADVSDLVCEITESPVPATPLFL